MNTKVIILAAGQGKRMGADIPKALVPIAGRPMIFYLLDAVSLSGISSRPVIVVGFEANQVLEILGEDVCEYAIQRRQLGTGHAVNCAKRELAGADNVIVLYGDHPFISAQVIRSLVKLHYKSDSVISMLTTTVPHYDDWYDTFRGWGRILRDNKGDIQGIREAKDATADELKICEVNPAMFCFSADWLWKNIDRLQNKNIQKEYYLTDLVELAVGQGKKITTANLPPEQSVGINTTEQLRFAEKLMKKNK